MCKYCENVRTGDDYCPIISTELPFGILGDIWFDVVLVGNMQKDPAISLQYQDGEERVKIKYCPMCGEKLVENEEV